METFIGTFSVSHETKSEVFQPIEAIDIIQACLLMKAKHGRNHMAVYPLAEYKSLQSEGFFKGHQPLKYIGGEQS